MRICYSLACVCLCLAFIGCGDKAGGSKKKSENSIVGTWVMADVEDGPAFVYAEDGTFKMELGPELPAQTGKYSIKDGTMTVEWDDSSKATTKKREIKVVVTGDSMTTTDEKGTEDKFKRKK
jgi:uncharacterized protein DUF5640